MKTAGIGLGSSATFNRTGGTVNVTGSLNNSGSTLTLNSITGNWNVNSSATINNSTLTGSMIGDSAVVDGVKGQVNVSDHSVVKVST